MVWENFLSLSTLQGISYVLPLIVLPYIFRVIGPEKFGLIAFAQALVQYFMIVTDYGFSLSATRKISLFRDEEEKVSAVFSSVMTVKMILALLSFIVLLGIINFIPKFKQDWIVYILSFGAVVGNTFFPVWFFQGIEKMKYITFINIAGGIIYMVSIFIFVRHPYDFLMVPAINSLFFLVTGTLGLYIALRKFKIVFVRQTYHEIREEIRTGWQLFISIVSINAYTTTRIFAVGLLTNNTLTGFYSIGEKIANAIQTFPLDSFSQAIYPRLSHIFKKNRKRALRIMRKTQKNTILSYAIALPVIYILTPWVTMLICGVAYKEVIITIRILLFAIFFIVAKAFRIQFLIVGGKADLYSKIHIAAALVGLPLIFLSIDYFSYMGAAISTVIIEAGIFLLTLKIISDLYKKY